MLVKKIGFVWSVIDSYLLIHIHDSRSIIIMVYIYDSYAKKLEIMPNWKDLQEGLGEYFALNISEKLNDYLGVIIEPLSKGKFILHQKIVESDRAWIWKGFA